MLTELVVYELVTGIIPFIGIKAWADKRYLRGINKPKTTPFDGYLRRRVGRLSKSEEFAARRGLQVIHHISQYKAMKYLLILAGRKLRAIQMDNTQRHLFTH
jgi:hypothetical protein